VEAFEGFISDVSNLKRSLEETERSKALFEGLFWGSPDAIAILDRHGRILQVNPAFEELFQYGQEEAQEVFIWDLIAPPDRRAEGQENHRTVLSGCALKRDSVRKKKDGSLVEVSLTGYPIRVGDEVQGIYAIYRDITAQKQAERALRESERRYRQLMEDVPVGIYDVDVNTMRLLRGNRALCEITGYSKEELLELRVQDFVAEESMGLLKERRQKILAGEQVPEIVDFVIRTKDGQKRLVRIHSRVTHDEHGGPKVKVVLEDVTEQKRLEAQFLQAQKMEAVGRLAGGVAHDINNALTGVLGYADLILTSLRREDPLYTHVEEIKKAARRASSTIQQLLTFSRRQIIHPTLLNLNRVICDLIPMLSRLIGEDIRLETFLASELGTVKADKGQIEQILMNLAVNSRDAMPDGGTLTIETADVELDKGYVRAHGVDLEPGSYVMLTVSDTGIGMDEETRKRVFEPFFTTKAVGEGTGLGLSTVYGIVKQSRGYIWVYSEPGKGTTFKIYLPRAGGKTEEEAEPQKVPAWGSAGNETILVVEDEEPLLALVKASLERAGYRVLTATAPQAALGIAQLHSGSIHLLLTDVVLPGMNGRLLAEGIRMSRPETKVLYMSGYTENAISHHGILDPEVEFLAKPFTPEELAQKVREVLDKDQ
jgi:PAS domain S-box-containing protein